MINSPEQIPYRSIYLAVGLLVAGGCRGADSLLLKHCVGMHSVCVPLARLIGGTACCCWWRLAMPSFHLGCNTAALLPMPMPNRPGYVHFRPGALADRGPVGAHWPLGL